jgi:hypothetical protein
MTRYLKIFTVIACVAALTAPSAAFAATSSQTGYGDDSADILPAVQDDGDSGDVAGTTADSDDGGDPRAARLWPAAPVAPTDRGVARQAPSRGQSAA